MLSRFLFALLVITSAPSTGWAQKRVALIIGNADYVKVGKLANPTRDAEAIRALLQSAKFDFVQLHSNVGSAEMRRALRDFSDRVRDAEIAVVFFAGHGIEVNGTNYLIPVDAILERDIDVEDETVSLERVSQILEPAKRLRFIILDACRDNPFLRSMRRTVGSRSIGRGLAEVRVLTSDTLIAFAAKAGSTATDGEAGNSPYTLALAKHLATPGLDLRLALGRVRDEVLRATANRQEPHYYGSLGGEEIPLMPAGLSAAAPKVSVPTASSEVVAPHTPIPAQVAQGAAKIGMLTPELEAGVRPTPYSGVQARGLFTEQHAKRIHSLAAKHGFNLPDFQIEIPASDVPAPLRRFIGVWVEETGNNGKYRKLMLIVTRVDKHGKAEGYWFYGPPTVSSYTQSPAGHFKVAGAITDETLRYADPRGTENYKHLLTVENRMNYNYSNAKGQTDTRVLSPLWTLVEAERSAKR